MRVASRLSSCVAVLATATLLSSCGTSAYCTSVEEQRGALDDVAMTTASLTALGEALRTIEKQATGDVKDDYTAVADAVEALLAAEQVSGVPVEELTHGDVVDLSEDDTAALRNAYQAFNDTATQRRAIADDVTDACDVTLKTPGA
ncbi:hypothetical protein [Aeromicrobium alkaliterrae]|uniref:Lipoprotein n=1 Tax=Aeromicrobium alkaliterrae TaxID=302168 RepID=A0ABP4VJJ0_9ACTN